MAQSLAVKYRPQTFEECLAQGSTIQILKKQLELRKFTNCYLFAGSSGCGKAQPLDSKVYTPTGYKLMQDVNPGDVILDGSGKPTTVLNVFPQGQRDIYRINFSDGTYIEVADNHLNTVYETKPITKTHKHLGSKSVEHILNTLELKEQIKQGKKYYIPAVCTDFTYQDVPVNPYLLGCLLGDGSISKNNLMFTNTDTEIIDTLNTILETDYSMQLKNITRNDYTLCSKDLYKYHIQYKGIDYYSLGTVQEALIADGYPKLDSETILNICNGKAKHYNKTNPELQGALKLISITDRITWVTHGLKKQLAELAVNTLTQHKHIPQQYIYNSKEIRLALLRGLMDTDGTVNKTVSKKGYTSANCSISTVSKQLAEDIVLLSRSLGFRATIIEQKNKTYTYKYKDTIVYNKPAQDVYSVYIKTDDDSQLFTLTRKKASVKKHQAPPRKKILSVEYDRKDDCKCIYVESPLHTYITDNITITHNTTVARIFANEINQHKGNPIEIDGASNNSVDNVRDIIAAAKERSVDSEYKIYIIDECHAISSAGWQAFLKCIEEPPQYTIFMFCTTNPEKIPDTIINRVMRFNITKVDSESIYKRLCYICQQEGYTNCEETCDYISKICNGGVRDAICTLEKAANYSTDLSIDNALTCLGNFSYNAFFKLTNDIIDGNEKEVIKSVEEAYNSGTDMKLFIEQYLDFTLDLCKFCLFQDITSVKIPTSLEKTLRYTTGIENNCNYFSTLVDKILNIKNMIKNDVNNKSTIEVMMINICRGM